MGLGGCAEVDEAAISVDAGNQVVVKQVSESCSVGLIFEWDGTPGPKTPAMAITEMLGNYEQRADAMPVGGPRAQPGDVNHDPVLTAVVIRALSAALASLPEAEQGIAEGQGIHVSAFDDSGTELARVEIKPQRSGGYRIDQLQATGFTSDHPTCA
jgi:hypothetical protein